MRISLLIFLLFTAHSGCCQLNGGFMWPLDTPCTLTGNYGELRPNHFHAGIDLSTRGAIKKNVYAAEKGYVSRLRVSSGGYGNCVYITHPGSKVTVYAHLHSFSLKIAKLVEEEQFRQKRFEVELLPAPGVISVSRGEIIGLSGNSGGSTGPHLHFEIRDEQSETPLNPLAFFKIPDVIPPVIEAVAFYDLSDTLNPRFVRSEKVIPSRVATHSFTLQQKELGIAFSGYDLNYAGGNRNNIYQAELYFDNRIVYAHRLRAIDFADSRYVNEFSEPFGRRKLQRCFVPTIYPPRLYYVYFNKGRISFTDSLAHVLKLVMSDEMGNVTEQEITLRSDGGQELRTVIPDDPLFVHCSRDFIYSDGALNLYVPGGTFYRSVLLDVRHDLPVSSSISILPGINMRNAFVLAFPVPGKFKNEAGKLVLKSGTNVFTGAARHDSVYFYPKVTGVFTLLSDKVPPEVRTFISQSRLKKMRNLSSMSFHISDKLSGIASYDVYLNGNWVIAEYDAKYSKLTYYFDNRTPAGSLDFRVEVTDHCGNTRKFSYRLLR